MNKQHPTHLSMTVDRDAIPAFFGFLQQGFSIRVEVGCSIQSLLCDQFGVSPVYIDERIQTIFLDGHPVDDVESAWVRDGSNLALCAAMPGLAGATLRRSGALASFRSAISHRGDREDIRRHEGVIVIKLFNLIIRELGPTFLNRGIGIRKSDLKKFFDRQSERFWEGCRSVRLDGREMTTARLRQRDWTHGSEAIVLQVDRNP